jgi:hypothetical protein
MMQPADMAYLMPLTPLAGVKTLQVGNGCRGWL